MKKICALVMSLALVLSLCGCGIVKDLLNFGKQEETEEVTTATDANDETEEAFETSAAIEVTEEVTNVEVTEEHEGEMPISIQEIYRSGEGWSLSWHTLSLSDSDAKKYPNLAYAFEKLNADVFYSYQKSEENYKNSEIESFYGDVYELSEYKVLRADEKVVCLLVYLEGYYGGAHGSYYYCGQNIDTETGETLEITDVVLSLDMLYVILANYVNENYADGIYVELSTELLHDQYGTDPVWTMDSEKITVYFNTYEIAPYAAGCISVELPFDEYSYLFAEKYTK